MKLMTLIAIASLALTTTACIGNKNERMREAAFQACKDRPDEQARVKCRKAERERLQAAERGDIAEIAKAEAEAEQRQGELEALGVPEGAREQPFNPVLGAPSR
jgi:hypothetical protein